MRLIILCFALFFGFELSAQQLKTKLLPVKFVTKGYTVTFEGDTITRSFKRNGLQLLTKQTVTERQLLNYETLGRFQKGAIRLEFGGLTIIATCANGDADQVNYNYNELPLCLSSIKSTSYDLFSKIKFDGQFVVLDGKNNIVADYGYKNGMLHGYCIDSPSGSTNYLNSKYQSIQYVNGLKHGISTYYHNNKFKTIETYNMGHLDSRQIYNGQGDVVQLRNNDASIIYYSKGQIIKSYVAKNYSQRSAENYQYIDYGISGNVLVTGELADTIGNDSIGIWRWYNAKGRLIEHKVFEELLLIDEAEEEVEEKIFMLVNNTPIYQSMWIGSRLDSFLLNRITWKIRNPEHYVFELTVDEKGMIIQVLNIKFLANKKARKKIELLNDLLQKMLFTSGGGASGYPFNSVFRLEIELLPE